MGGQDRVAAVILAAGESRRFGSPKQLALLDGRSLLEHVLELAASVPVDPVIAVVPTWLTRPASFADARALVWVRNPDPARGMSHSLRLGFAALPKDVAAALILLGDQPQVPVDHLRTLLAARGPRPFVATATGSVLGPPALVERSHFEAVDDTRGDEGLREALRADPSQLTAIPLATATADLDTVEDLRRLAEDG